MTDILKHFVECRPVSKTQDRYKSFCKRFGLRAPILLAIALWGVSAWALPS